MSSVLGVKVVDQARKQKGEAYSFGNPQASAGNTQWGYRQAATESDLNGADCSGLFYWAMVQQGYEFPKGVRPTATWLYQNSRPISVEDAKTTPGALLFLFSSGKSTPYHVELSTGDGSNIVGARVSAGIVEKSWDGIAAYEKSKKGAREAAAMFPGVTTDKQLATAEPLPGAEGSSSLPLIVGGIGVSIVGVVGAYMYWRK